MKVFALFTKSLIFVLILSALAFAQTEKTQNASTKIAVINSEAFYNKETGIKEILETNDKLEAEFKPQLDELNTIAEKIKKIEKELRDIHTAYEFPRNIKETIDSKIAEYDSLSCQYVRKQNAAETLYQKRKSEVLANVNKKISEAIKQFAKDKGYIAILDVSKCTDCLTGNFNGENNDVTLEFIQYYSENFAKFKTQ